MNHYVVLEDFGGCESICNGLLTTLYTSTKFCEKKKFLICCVRRMEKQKHGLLGRDNKISSTMYCSFSDALGVTSTEMHL